MRGDINKPFQAPGWVMWVTERWTYRRTYEWTEGQTPKRDTMTHLKHEEKRKNTAKFFGGASFGLTNEGNRNLNFMTTSVTTHEKEN